MADSRRFHTLASLLDAQPRGLLRDSRYRLMWDCLMTSERLQRLRISSRCYRLLDRATVPPENLGVFRRTYRLPDNPFFPLFLAVKRSWLDERARWKEERSRGIGEIMGQLPPGRSRVLKALSGLEDSLNPAGRHPEWNRLIKPVSKKRAREYLTCGDDDWHRISRVYLDRLVLRYRNFGGRAALEVQALIVLDCAENIGGKIPPENVIREHYRRLSKVHHPDRGGDPAVFRRLRAASEVLLRARAGSR